jgi:hypothetical protein
MWDDQQSSQPKRGQNSNIDPNDVFNQVNQQFGQAGIDINIGGRQRRRGCGCGIWVILGIISFISIFVFAFGVAFFPDFAAMTSPAFCPKNTTLKTVEGRQTYDGTEVFFQCFDNENQMVEDVSLKIVAVIMGLVCLPFLFIGLGSLSAFGGLFRLGRNLSQTATVAAMGGGTFSTSNVEVLDLRDKARRGELSQEDMQRAQQMLQSVMGGMAGGGSGSNIAERLRELQDAYNSQLITREEYDAKRDEILKSI